MFVPCAQSRTVLNKYFNLLEDLGYLCNIVQVERLGSRAKSKLMSLHLVTEQISLFLCACQHQDLQYLAWLFTTERDLPLVQCMGCLHQGALTLSYLANGLTANILPAVQSIIVFCLPPHTIHLT